MHCGVPVMLSPQKGSQTARRLLESFTAYTRHPANPSLVMVFGQECRVELGNAPFKLRIMDADVDRAALHCEHARTIRAYGDQGKAHGTVTVTLFPRTPGKVFGHRKVTCLSPLL